MRVKISELILWQWKTSVFKPVNDGEPWGYNPHDEEIVRDLMRIIRKKGMHGLPPIVIRKCAPFAGTFNIKRGQTWFVHDGFHRVYALERLGYKTVIAVTP